MHHASSLLAPRYVRRLAFVAAAALVLAILPLATGTASADYEITEYPGDPGTIVIREGDDLIPSVRYRGLNRFDTARLIAEDTDTVQADPADRLATSDTVIVARADFFPDALSGSYLSGLTTSPILLVSTGGAIEPHTREGLETIDPDNVIILGGLEAISQEVEDELAADYETTRVRGTNRFGTAAAIAMEGADDSPITAIVASGEEFPDALVSGSISYAAGLPLLLTGAGFLPDETAEALEALGIEEVLLIGGTGRIQEEVELEIAEMGIDVERVFGRTRVGTAAALADLAVDRYGFTTTHVNIARGDAFPDALTMGPHAGEEEAVMLLTVDPNRFDDGQNSNAGFMEDSGCVRVIHLAGGVEAITPDTEQALRTAATQPGICFTLTPADATNLIGEPHTVTATLTEDGLPIDGNVSFTVTADDDSDAVPVPDAADGEELEDGSATFTFTSLTPGSVTITACVDDADEELCAEATKTFNTEAFVDSISLAALMGHLEELQACADDNGDREASGPGYDCSVDYVRDSLIAAGYPAEDIEETAFDFVLWEENAPGILTLETGEVYSTDDEEEIASMSYSGDTGGEDVTGPLVGATNNGTTEAGCAPGDFPAETAGAIAVVRRGTCPFQQKAENAADAGAVGVIIYNSGIDGNDGIFFGTLSAEYSDRDVPAFGATYAFGLELLDRAADDEEATMVTDTSFSDEASSNLVLSIPGSDPQGAIMNGAHLDSVAGGPGINDNGSGSAGILEVALQMAEHGIEPVNDIYFAWWGAEESGLIGSWCFVEGFCGGDLEDGRVVDFSVGDYTDLGYALLEGGYLNYDMIASPNFMRGIYDGDGSEFGVEGPPGSAQIEAEFEGFYEARGLITQPSDFSGRSDYVGFTTYNIAAGGLFTGAEGVKTEEEQEWYGGVAGESYDPCYHQPCDSLVGGWTPPDAPEGYEANVHQGVFLENSGAAAHLALLYAMSIDSLSDDGGMGLQAQSQLTRANRLGATYAHDAQ